MKHLVLASGLTGSGKSWASKYMKGELGFYRICLEEIRDILYGTGYIADPLKKGAANGLATDQGLWEAEMALRKGENVVIDSGATKDERRRELLDYFDSDDVRRCILIFEANPETRIKRVIGRPGQYGRRMTPDEVREHVYNDMLNWKEPDMPGIEIVRYIRETPEDDESIMSDLRRRFQSNPSNPPPYLSHPSQYN